MEYEVSVTQPDRLSSWQPIEAAPKDGTSILVGCFDARNQWFGSDIWHEGKWLNHHRCAKRLTHWMPMPPPPATPVIDELGFEEIKL